MKTLRFLHTADWHADNDPKKQTKLEASLSQMLDYVKENKVNAIINAGDIWEKKQSYADKSGVPMVIEYLRAMSKHVDFIFITKGNNSHDEPGSVSLLHQLEPNIYAYEYPVSIAVVNTHAGMFVKDILRNDFDDRELTDYIISLVPYPTKASFISEDSIDNNNADFLEKFEEVFELIGNITQSYTCPKVLAFHGNVVGSRLSTGQTLVSQDIMVAPRTLQKAKHDYYALGHIHLRQEVAPNMVYSGSIYNKSWGETEQKSFEIVEFDTSYGVDDDFGLITNQIMLTSAKPMVKLEAEFDAEKGFITIWEEGGFYENPQNSEVRYRVKVKENDRKLITEDKINELKEFFETDGNTITIEFNIVPDERESRSEKIMNCKTLLDEVEEYAKVVEFEMTESMKEKVLSLQNEEVFV